MNKGIAPLLALAIGFLLLANASAQDAKPLRIVNGSFESPTVAEGTYSGGTPGWGWTGLSGSINAIIHPGGPGEGEPWPTTQPAGMDGINFCKLYAYADQGTGVLYQDTGIKYQAGTTYTLTAAFGLQTNPDGKLAPNCMMFVANSSLTQLGSITISEANLTAGEFKDQTVTYTATGSEAAGDGTYGVPGDIIVGFWLPSAPANTYLDFDNVRLKAPQAGRPAPSATPEQPNYFGTHM